MGFQELCLLCYGTQRVRHNQVEEPGSIVQYLGSLSFRLTEGRRRETVVARTGQDGRGGRDERGRCWVIFGPSAAS